MSDILLLNPPYTRVGYKTLDNLASRALPLGLGMLSGTLKEGGFSFDVLDADALNKDPNDVITYIAKLKPRIIGMSTYTSYASMITYLVKEIKNALKDSIVVLGGHHAFAMKEKLLEETAADIIAIGEGEFLFRDLCRAILNKKPVDDVSGIYFRKEGRIIFTSSREYIKNLDGIPMPAYEYFPMESYKGHFYRNWVSGYRKPFSNIVTSRGCPFRCGFCSNQLWGKKVRFQSPERVIRDVDYLVRHFGIRQFSFFDDTFTLDQIRANKICDLLIARGYNLDIYCSTRIDCLDADLIKKMARSGFKWIGIGIESGNDRILKIISKGRQTVKRCSEILSIIADNGIAIYGSAILGYPGEDKKTLKDTLSFMINNPIHLPQFSIFIPYPNTPVYNELVKKGVKPLSDMRELSNVVSYNKGISSLYLGLFQLYSYIRCILRIKYFKLIRKIFKLKIVFSDLVRIALAMARLPFKKKTSFHDYV